MKIVYGGIFFVTLGFISLGAYFLYSANQVSKSTGCVYSSTINTECKVLTDKDHREHHFRYTFANLIINNRTYPGESNTNCDDKMCNKCGCEYIIGRTYTCWSESGNIFFSCDSNGVYGVKVIAGILLIISSVLLWGGMGMHYRLTVKRDYGSIN